MHPVFTYASSFYMCTQFLHLLPVFCLACSFDIIICIQFKIAFPWVCWGETRIAWHKTREGKKLSCLRGYSYWNLLHTNDHWIMVNRKIWKKLKFLWIKHSCLMILQMVSHTTINIPMKGHVHGQFSDMNETTKHIKVLTKYLWMTSLPMSSALTMALSPTTLPP